MSMPVSVKRTYAARFCSAAHIVFCVLVEGVPTDMQIPASCSCSCGKPFPKDSRGSFMAPLPEGVRCLVCDDASCEWPVSRIISKSYAEIHGSDGSIIIQHGANGVVLSAGQPAKCYDARMCSSSAIESTPKSCLTCGNCCNNPVIRFVADQKPDEVSSDLLRIARTLRK